MPKKTDHPRLRTHIRKGENGQVWVSWWYDMRPEGKKDVSLGTNYEQAIEKWREHYENRPRISGTILEAMNAWEAEKLDNLETRYASEETRKGYRRQLARIRKVFGPATWDSVGMPELKGYLKKRTAKTQGNRELAVLSIVWNYARGEGLTKLPWPAAGMEKSKWKNKETPREFEVTDALFAAIYSMADATLCSCMDLASATGLRLTDCRTVQMPPGDVLRVRSSKTGKGAEFSVTDSPVLSRLCTARRAQSAPHLMLLTTSTGRPVSARMLRDRWDEAREKAALANPELADDLRAMYLRDMRKRAADLADDDAEASKLLQHESVALTKRHYRSKPTRLRPVR